MSNYLEILNLDLSTASMGGKIRQQMLQSTPWTPTPTTNVSYVAANRLLIIANLETGNDVEARLPQKILNYIAIPSEHSGTAATTNAYHCTKLTVSGYLGRFHALLHPYGTPTPTTDDCSNLADVFDIETGLFDQVLDCSDTPLIAAAIKPPGYHHVGRSEESLEAAIKTIPELIGEFEKPKYFDYNPDICAHGRSGIGGCTRCLDACPTQAISSLTDTVEIATHLCQGGGTCASSCPTGAIRYIYPKTAEQIEFLRVMLKSTRQKTSDRGVTLLVFDNEHGREFVEAVAAQFDDHIFPFVVDEIGSVGLDLIASAMAYGANRVCLYVPASVPEQVTATLQSNLAVIAAVVEQTGCETYRAEIISDLGTLIKGDAPDPVKHAARFAPLGDSRNIIRAALSFFAEISPAPPASANLPTGSLFGQIHLNTDACTLCMGCVSVCPASALQAGDTSPALKFIEANCVQCGICKTACPEHAISLESRLHFDHGAITKPSILKQETPFQCIRCGKAFATQSMIARMTEKLQDHWMFATSEAMERLRMCEDCRVKDIFSRENTTS